MWGSNWPVYTSAHHPWEEPAAGGSQAVSAYPNFTPMILKPKTPSYNRSFLSVRVSLCECWWYWYREERKRWREKNRREALSTEPRVAGIWQIAARQNFRASIFHVGRKAKNKRDSLRAFFKQSYGTKSTPRDTLARVVYLPLHPESREIVGDFLKLALRRR